VIVIPEDAWWTAASTIADGWEWLQIRLSVATPAPTSACLGARSAWPNRPPAVQPASSPEQFWQDKRELAGQLAALAIFANAIIGGIAFFCTLASVVIVYLKGALGAGGAAQAENPGSAVTAPNPPSR
jgi:hypothetical protein